MLQLERMDLPLRPKSIKYEVNARMQAGIIMDSLKGCGRAGIAQITLQAHILKSQQHRVDRTTAFLVYIATIEIFAHHLHPKAMGQSSNGHNKQGTD